MEQQIGNWRKSSYSNGGEATCVEVGTASASIAVRDTTDRDGGTLTFTASSWQAFLGTLR
jgi:hypothetical protein